MLEQSRRFVSKRDVAQICAAMRSLAESELAGGTMAAGRRYCDACQRPVCAAGFVQYGRYAICNSCATEYEVAKARGRTPTIGRYVRDKNFGETALYSLDVIH